MADGITKHLRKDELGCHVFLIQSRQMGKTALKKFVDLLHERLAECRRLMEKAKQYIEDDLSGMPFDDDQVKELEARGKRIYTELAQAIKGE